MFWEDVFPGLRPGLLSILPTGERSKRFHPTAGRLRRWKAKRKQGFSAALKAGGPNEEGAGFFGIDLAG